MQQDIEKWLRELREAGWQYVRNGIYQAPCGCVYLGPYRAWTVMLARKEDGRPCPNDHSHQPRPTPPTCGE